MRALEETMLRKERDRDKKCSHRQLETEQETSSRKIINKERMAANRQLESEEKACSRRQNDRQCKHKRIKRQLENEEEACSRKIANKERIAANRQLESEEKACSRRQNDRQCKRIKRQLESEEKASSRKMANKEKMAKRRAISQSISSVIENFLNKVRIGAEFVCTICHRLLYRQSVVGFNCDKYVKLNADVKSKVFELAYVCSDGKQWICTTCHAALNRGNIPVQTKANGLQLSPIPDELSDLNTLELRLISLRIPFMKMVALPSGVNNVVFMDLQ